MNEPASQTSPTAPFALPHPPAEPCKAGIPAGKGPLWPGGDGGVPDCRVCKMATCDPAI